MRWPQGVERRVRNTAASSLLQILKSPAKLNHFPNIEELCCSGPQPSIVRLGAVISFLFATRRFLEPPVRPFRLSTPSTPILLLVPALFIFRRLTKVFTKAPSPETTQTTASCNRNTFSTSSNSGSGRYLGSPSWKCIRRANMASSSFPSLYQCSLTFRVLRKHIRQVLFFACSRTSASARPASFSLHPSAATALPPLIATLYRTIYFQATARKSAPRAGPFRIQRELDSRRPRQISAKARQFRPGTTAKTPAAAFRCPLSDKETK